MRIACSLFIVAVVAINGNTIAIAGIHAYQAALAPVAAKIGLRCRFAPSCSHYAEVAIARDGLIRGGWKAMTRIARCGPWTAPGTQDQP